MTTVTIRQPDDWHLHLREGDALKTTVPHSAMHFARAMVMPNLKDPVTTVDKALAYRSLILANRPAGSSFNPLMTVYLTDNTPVSEIRKIADTPEIIAVKLYPAGATTNSDAGVTSLSKCTAVLAEMEKLGVPLSMHGEVAGDVDIFDREEMYIDKVLIPLRKDFPSLKCVYEHITTKAGIDYVSSATGPLGATVTPHHLLLNRNDIFNGGICAHHYCLPVLKREEDRRAILAAVTDRNNTKFFAGTDSAPHLKTAKESGRGPGGCYSAPIAVSLYAHAFDSVGAVGRLEPFLSLNGPAFYGLPANTGTITLEKADNAVPDTLPFGNGVAVPPMAGRTISWRVKA